MARGTESTSSDIPVALNMFASDAAKTCLDTDAAVQVKASASDSAQSDVSTTLEISTPSELSLSEATPSPGELQPRWGDLADPLLDDDQVSPPTSPTRGPRRSRRRRRRHGKSGHNVGDADADGDEAAWGAETPGMEAQTRTVVTLHDLGFSVGSAPTACSTPKKMSSGARLESSSTPVASRPSPLITSFAAEASWCGRACPISPCHARSGPQGIVSTSPVPFSTVSTPVGAEVASARHPTAEWPASPTAVRTPTRSSPLAGPLARPLSSCIMSTSPVPLHASGSGAGSCCVGVWSAGDAPCRSPAGSATADALRSWLHASGLPSCADLQAQLQAVAPVSYED